MEVRPATADDLPALLPLMRGYCDFYEADPPDSGLEAMARALIAAPDAEGMLFVAEDDAGAVAGFAALGWKWSSLRGARIAVLEDLFVAADSRGAGLATTLISASGKRAHELGAAALEWVTATDNERAQRAYARAGGEGAKWLVYELDLEHRSE
jgi:GNAT superfamily N-acetyltransferase